jgi:methionyl-tRNA synthetase
MVGKDILRFHAVYWPAMLLAAGLEPPERVFAHGWWTNEGQKISKSLGNVIDPFSLVEKYGLDAVRYFLMREVPFGNDGDFSHTAMTNRLNGDLANDLGNLCQRCLTMIARNCEGRVPAAGRFGEAERTLLGRTGRLLDEVRELLARQEIHQALITIWAAIGDANRYFAAAEPWALRKTDPERMATVLYVTAEAIRRVALLVQPAMPNAASRILDQLGVATDARHFGLFGEGGALTPGNPLPPPEPVFPRWAEDAEARA